PADSIDLSGLKGLPRVLMTVGDGLAKLGPWGGAAAGAGMGFLIQGGANGIFLPAICAFLIGMDGNKARNGAEVLKQGPDAIMKAAELRQDFTPARGTASAVTIAACCAELAVGFSFGTAGLIVAIPAMLGTAYAMGRAASQAEGYVLEQAVQQKFQPAP
ncbi:MAG: hypothetical protein AB1758_36295, partial [Candidatus Eremiobacterota bacterium]